MMNIKHLSKQYYLSNFVFLCSGFGLIYLATVFSSSVFGIDIPITGQSLAVLVVSYLWPRKLGLYAVLSYVIIGVMGLPVFSNGAYGLEVITGNSGGYIYGFVIASWFVQKCKTSYKGYRFGKILCTMFLSTLIILVIGAIHLSFIIGVKDAFLYGVKPFLIGGIIKIILGTYIVWGVGTQLNK